MAKIAKNLIAKIRKPFERIKLLNHFSPSSLPVQAKSTTRLNACIHESNFVGDMTKKRRAAAHFALLFASLAILRLASA